MGRKVSSPKWVATKSIVNGISTNGWSDLGLAFSSQGSAKTVASGALTANTLATVLSISGAGLMPILAMTTADATARTMRMQVIVDSVTVFDSTSESIATSSRGGIVAGVGIGSASLQLMDGEPIRWNSTLVIKVASSLTETDKINIHYRYHLT